MRLPNGYGSVYKLSGKRRNPYVARITIGWTDEGKQILKTIGYYKSKQEGLNALAEYHKNPYDLDLNNITFKEVWFKVEKELEGQINDKKMTQGNLDSLNFAFNNHLKPIHDDKLLEIKFRKLQELINNATVRDTDKELSYSGKGYMKTVCVKVYNYAIDILEAPINNIATRISVGSKGVSNKHIPFTNEEISILWGVQYNDLVKIILIWLYTGLRPNEIFKTKREDVHLEEKYFITGSKTKAGKNRIIPIHRKIEHLIKYFYLKESLFDIYGDYNKVKREFDKLMNNLGMKHTPYDCRHTFITKMKKANVNEYLLKRIVGHSIQDLTEKTYTHRDIEELLFEINKIC